MYRVLIRRTLCEGTLRSSDPTSPLGVSRARRLGVRRLGARRLRSASPGVGPRAAFHAAIFICTYAAAQFPSGSSMREEGGRSKRQNQSPGPLANSPEEAASLAPGWQPWNNGRGDVWCSSFWKVLPYTVQNVNFAKSRYSRLRLRRAERRSVLR